MTETTERVPRDELHRLLVMTAPPRPASQIAAARLPAIPPVRPPRVRAPTLLGTPIVVAAVAPIVVEVAPPPVVVVPVVAMAPAVVAASVPPHRFAIAAVFYALVLFALLAIF